MIRKLSLLGIMACVMASSVIAEEALPTVVQSSLSEETVLVARIDLARSDVETITKFIAEVPDPAGEFGKSSALFGQTLRNLATLKVREVFLVLSTDDLPDLRPTLVVSTEGKDAERMAIAESLKSVWNDRVEMVPGGVIVRQSQSPTEPPPAHSSNRPEFVSGFASVKDSQVQVAVSLGKDSRRVLREIWPRLPDELGGSPISSITEDWKWLALGFTPSSMPSAKMIIQAKDASSAESLQRIVAAGLKTALETERAKSIFGNASGLLSLLSPSRESDQLVLSITEANLGASRLKNEVVTPLLGQMETNSRRTQSVNHLMQIGLAMHNYHDQHKSFPTAAVVNPNGKKLLSWRVLLLPLLDENELFMEFHLNESWDSEHNRKLITRMPDVFASANISRDQRAKGMTTYLAPIADKTLFASSSGITIKQITDGTSNTIMVVDSNSETAVPWTKPDDLPVDFKAPLKGLTGQPNGNFWTVLCDGSARAIPESIDAETMRRLLQINDGEVIGGF